ncbi:MAG TPA: GNAT family N-acetyltransferase [Micromonosporaceae bacterium]|nr:GNAT family N-acetyltransferase [Micromonosporaceae bacterium]
MTPATVELAAAAVALLRDWSEATDPPEQRWAALALRHSVPTSIDNLRRDKLLSPYLRLAVAGAEEANGAWPRELARQQHRAAVLAAELRTVDRCLREHGVEYAVLRGPALQRCYPLGWPREANDIDVLVPNPRGLAGTIAAVAEHGYYVARPVVCRRDPTAGGVWAAAALNRRRPDLGHPVYLDVAAGGLAIDSTRCLPIPAAAWDTRTTVTEHGSTFSAFAPTQLAVNFAVELMERDQPICRDLLDFIVIARQQVDWAEVRAQVRRHDVTHGLDALAELATAAGATEPAERLSWLTAGGSRSRYHWRARMFGLTDRAYRFGRRVSARLTLATVERLPARPWFGAGLPVYAYPPRADGTPLRGTAVTAWLPDYRARIKAIARAEEVEEIFESVGDLDPYAELTDVELVWWRNALRDQFREAAVDGAEETQMTWYADSIVDDDGAAGTAAVREDGVAVAAMRVAECLHPLTHFRDRRIEGLVARPPDAAAALLERLPTDLQMRVEVPMHGSGVALSEPLQRYGFQPEVLTVRRRTSSSWPESDWTIRPAVPTDADFVYDCLATAVRRGLLGQEPDVDLDQWVRARFPDPSGSEAVCVVAEQNGDLVGHGYAILRPDRYLSRPCGYVVDVFVLRHAQGRGCSVALTTALGTRLHEAGVPVVESEVVLAGNPNPAPLRDRLAAAGWREERMRWVREPR